MATGILRYSSDAVKDSYSLWYKPGDTEKIASGKVSYTGFLTSNGKFARVVIPLTKPIKPNTTVIIYGNFRIRTVAGDDTQFDLAKSSAITCTPTVSGLSADIGNNTTLGSPNLICALATQSTGLTIEFS